MEIKVMSYNVQHFQNYITGKINYDAVAEVIRKYGAEVVGLNEVRGEGPASGYEAQAKIVAEKLGYHYYFAPAIMVKGANPYGNALLSKYPIEACQNIPIPDPEPRQYRGYYETRCVLKATVKAEKPFTVLVSHFGLNPDEHELATETVLKNLEKERCVLMGDFNMAPENPRIQRIAATVNDSAAKFSEPLLSIPSDKPTVKIDYLFTTDDIRVLSADIPAETASDHRPYVAELEL